MCTSYLSVEGAPSRQSLDALLRVIEPGELVDQGLGIETRHAGCQMLGSLLSTR